MQKDNSYNEELRRARAKQGMHDQIDQLTDNDSYFFTRSTVLAGQEDTQTFIAGSGDVDVLAKSIAIFINQAKIPLDVVILEVVRYDASNTYRVNLSEENVEQARQKSHEAYKQRKEQQ